MFLGVPRVEKAAQSWILSVPALVSCAKWQKCQKVTIYDARAKNTGIPQPAGFLRNNPSLVRIRATLTLGYLIVAQSGPISPGPAG